MERDSNDDLSDSMNPNNDAHQDNLDNDASELNPNNGELRGESDFQNGGVKDWFI